MTSGLVVTYRSTEALRYTAGSRGLMDHGEQTGQAHPLFSHLAQPGWVCVAINYRLSPNSEWPSAIIDVKQAIAWVKEHIAQFGGDSGFIAITGGSAGGHLPRWQH